jgi:hypothetical protein
VNGISGAVREEAMNAASARLFLFVMVFAIISAGLVLAAASGHTAVPHAATAIEYGL